MWAFLATEVLFFGGLFAAYAMYRLLDPAAWTEGSSHTKFWLETSNTAVLLCGSLSMALAVDAAKTDRRKLLGVLLAVTALLARCFWASRAMNLSWSTKSS